VDHIQDVKLLYYERWPGQCVLVPDKIVKHQYNVCLAVCVGQNLGN